jgi:hypothetical protein
MVKPKKASGVVGDDVARIEYVRLSALKLAKRNPKTHDVAAIMASIRRHGFIDPLVENERTGRLVAGHGRCEAIQAIKVDTPDAPPARVKVDVDGEWLLPVIRGIAFKDERRAEEYLLASNRLSEIGGWDSRVRDAVGFFTGNI